MKVSNHCVGMTCRFADGADMPWEPFGNMGHL
jgi:hypothetical protein